MNPRIGNSKCVTRLDGAHQLNGEGELVLKKDKSGTVVVSRPASRISL
jgi:hypothetical protein